MNRESDAVRGAREDSLRRIAALVAGGAASADVFAAIAREVGGVVGLPLVVVWRYAADRTTATVIGAWSEGPHPFQPGTRWPLDGPAILTHVLQTARPARIDDFSQLAGTIADAARKIGLRAGAGAPIIVDGNVWGAMSANPVGVPLPDNMEHRLAEFTDLVATAIASAESRAGLAQLAEAQAALRRVATLVARGTRPEEVFAAVANEVAQLLSVEVANVIRSESDDTVTLVASAGERIPVGSRWPIGETTLAPIVLKTGRPARVDNYAEVTGRLAEDLREHRIRSSVAAPIMVEGRVWGQMVTASSQEQPLPPDTEERLSSFTELMATAVANAAARSHVERLVDEQAALRRVATLVAEGAAAAEVFETVTREIAILCGADLARMERYESDDTVIGVAGWSRCDAPGLAVGTRFSLEGASIAARVRELSRPVRIETFAGAHGPIAQEARGLGIRCSVGCPIVVDGRLWGVIAASSKRATPFAADTETQIAGFTDLVATAIANSDARTEAAASRARIVVATDEERRRVVRDLHDGAQQRLVHTVITLKLAHRALRNEDDDLPELLTEALENAERAMGELRELAHGILPAVLTQGGLRAGVDSLASRMPVPVENAVFVGRLPAAVEATAYFVVAEALTNVAKHARARRATVSASIEDGAFQVQVRDDGVGGVRPDGHGLVGLADRLAALGGELRIDSPVEGGTLVAAAIPLRGSL